MARGRVVQRAARAAAVVAGALAGSAWLLVPAFRDRAWTRNGLPVDTFWLDSYGAGQVLSWLASGELFDAGRLPVITVLAAAGVVLAIARARTESPMRAVLALSVVSLVMYFGRPTLGPVVDLLPARDDLYLHRMIVGVHLGGVLLAGVGLAAIGHLALAAVRGRRVQAPCWAITAAAVVLVGVLLAPAWSQVRRTALDGRGWMAEQSSAQSNDGADFAALVRRADVTGGGRIYAGTLSGWGRDYRIGHVPAVIELTNLDVDGIGFTGRVPALTEPSEARFDDTDPAHYEVFGVRWAVLPDSQPPPPGSRLVESRGRHRLYELPAVRLLQVGDVTAPIVTDRKGIEAAVGAFLRSSMPVEGLYPRVDLSDERAATGSAGDTGDGSPAGHLDVVYELPGDGVMGAQVTLRRPAAVILKMSYHPRWSATVDGVPAEPILVAPGYPAVEVPAGTHVVELRYRAISGWETLGWMVLGALALTGLALWDRRTARARRAADQPPDDGGGAPVSGGTETSAGALAGGGTP